MSNDIYNVSVEYKSQGYQQATNEYEKFVQVTDKGSKAEGVAATASNKNTQAKQKLTRATRDTASAQQRARQQFLGLANSIAVLDGPLGGVASRFSAFGVLIGRIGIPLAGLSIGLSAFTFSAQRAVRQFAEFEVQLSTIENRLKSFGNQVNLTSGEIVRMSENLGLSTLADEREVMRAAGQLLTFRNISTEVFEDVLKAAQDLAASGFGTLESETIKLAKALEDPRQSLTSLSRAGVVFTRQQRQMITTLVDTGREAEAMALILDNVEKQVGGAGLAQANNTLSGSFDTIGQGIRTLTRDFGEFVGTSRLFKGTLDALANAASDYVRKSALDEESLRIEALSANIKGLHRDIENFESLRSTAGFLDANSERVLADLNIAYGEQLELLKQITTEKEESNRQEEILKAIQGSESQLNRREENLENLKAQIDLQRELVGVTQEQERVMRAMSAAGLGGDAWANITVELERYRANLIAAGEDHDTVIRKVEEQRAKLVEVRNIAEQYTQVFKDQAIARQIDRITESTIETNNVLRIQVRILEEARAAGDNALTVTEARRLAEIEVERQLIQTAIATNQVAVAAALMSNNFADAAVHVGNIFDLMSTLAAIGEREGLQAQVSALGRPSRGGGGGGGGGADPNAEFQRELDSLNTYLERRREEMMIAAGFEKELVMEQYDERFQVLQNALDRRLLTEQEYTDKVLELTQSREDKITEIEEAAYRSRMSFTAGILGDMAGAMQAGGDRMVKIAAGIAFAQGVINAHLAYTQALADPTIPSTLAKIGFAAKVFGLGMNAANAIKGAGGGGGAGGRTANAPREVRELAPQRVLIQGLDPQALYTGEQLTQLFEAFYSENDNRGRVFVVNQ